MVTPAKNIFLKQALAQYTRPVPELTKVLNDPVGEHVEAKVDSICVGHAHFLFAVLNAPTKKRASDDHHLVVPHRGAACHTLLYHMSNRNLLPPPTTRVQKGVSSNFYTSKRNDWLPRSLATRDALAKRAADGDSSAQQQLADFLAAPFDVDLLRPRDAALAAKIAARTVGGGRRVQATTTKLASWSPINWKDDFDWSGGCGAEILRPKHRPLVQFCDKRKRAECKIQGSLDEPCAACPECKCRLRACVRVRVQSYARMSRPPLVGPF
jgi:hypothetical protein